jgi:hypothetical protein
MLARRAVCRSYLNTLALLGRTSDPHYGCRLPHATEDAASTVDHRALFPACSFSREFVLWAMVSLLGSFYR